MTKNEVEIGMNRTGIDLSPIDKQLLIEGAMETVPSTPGDGSALAEARATYLGEDASIGTIPPPATVHGMATAVVEAVKGTRMTIFLDKLGERLAFERTGSRLYTSLLGKLDASEPLQGGPTRADLEQIREQEIAHFEMLREAMLSLGADATAITPSADVAAVCSMGLIQVIGDPRMSLLQSLEAILVAELVDNECWPTLVELARQGGHDELVPKFEQAVTEEAVHLSNVRLWVKNGTLGSAEPLRSKPARPRYGG